MKLLGEQQMQWTAKELPAAVPQVQVGGQGRATTVCRSGAMRPGGDPPTLGSGGGVQGEALLSFPFFSPDLSHILKFLFIFLWHVDP